MTLRIVDTAVQPYFRGMFPIQSQSTVAPVAAP